MPEKTIEEMRRDVNEFCVCGHNRLSHIHLNPEFMAQGVPTYCGMPTDGGECECENYTKQELLPEIKMIDRIIELETILDECFEAVIAPLGADIVINPSQENEDLANRVHQILNKGQFHKKVKK